jgi:ribosome-associated heat shock protein Hsp15
MRLDKWLWFARLAPSRTDAQTLCESRRLRLDGRVIERAAATVRPGSVLSFPRGDQVLAVRVEAIAKRRGPYAEASQLYTPLLPATGPAPAWSAPLAMAVPA